jgi:hypothetical protein
LKGLSKTLGWDVGTWLVKVLVKSKESRVCLEAWREELAAHMKAGGACM